MTPTPEFQLGFLTKLQRVFAEGDFTATYKFALLIALADLAVEHGKDDDSSLEIKYRDIGLKFIELYWQQATPYKNSEVLFQNLGKQAVAIRKIVEYRREHHVSTVHAAQSDPQFRSLITAVTSTVKSQPVKYLQNLAGGQDEFLYQADQDGLRLLSGVSFCLRRFRPLIQQLAINHWLDHIKTNKLNVQLVGKDAHLEEFLFETPRQALKVACSELLKLNRKCLYCGGGLDDKADVDHFIPHALYPRDLMHNLVLAHASCNRSKSDTLAAKAHLLKWREYANHFKDQLYEIGEKAGINADASTTYSVARWGYSNAIASSSQAWIKQKNYEPISINYLEAFEQVHGA